MIRTTVGKPFTRSSTTFLFQLRNASTSKAKSKAALKKTKGVTAPVQPELRLDVNQTWTIDPGVGYWTAKIRYSTSPVVIALTVSLALGSIVANALAFPNPDSLPTSSEVPGEANVNVDAKPPKSIFTVLFLPIKFVFRSLFVGEEARAQGQETWLYWGGCTAGFSAFTIFLLSRFLTPRYIRALSISPASINGRGGVLRIQPAIGRAVTCPVRETILVSPVIERAKIGKVLSTVTIEGSTLRGALMGWGLCMFRNGAVVNGQRMRQEEVIALMEKIWVQRGGEIKVG